MGDRESQPELWTKYEAAAYLGVKPNSVRKICQRHGIDVAGRSVDAQGRAYALYRADDVRARRR